MRAMVALYRRGGDWLELNSTKRSERLVLGDGRRTNRLLPFTRSVGAPLGITP